ncbi:MAG: SAM-dependent methyltransferase [Ruthenibacterium lactatiformans]
MEGENNEKRRFYSVGVGPGDPELITLKAVRTLERCPVVAAADENGEMLALSIARQAVSLEGKTVVPLHFTMSRDKAQQHAAHLAAAQALRPHLTRGGTSPCSTWATFPSTPRPPTWRHFGRGWL